MFFIAQYIVIYTLHYILHSVYCAVCNLNKVKALYISVCILHYMIIYIMFHIMWYSFCRFLHEDFPVHCHRVCSIVVNLRSGWFRGRLRRSSRLCAGLGLRVARRRSAPPSPNRPFDCSTTHIGAFSWLLLLGYTGAGHRQRCTKKCRDCPLIIGLLVTLHFVMVCVVSM